MTKVRVLVTGGTGFIGSALVKTLSFSSKYDVRVAIRQKQFSYDISSVVVGDITHNTDWVSSLLSVDVVVHTAARAHIINSSAGDSLQKFREVNSLGTLNLARQAAEAGVSRFIFLSSIGVNGSSTTTAFTEDDIPLPLQDYAISKLEAENGLQEIASSSDMDFVIIRPPLVYGPNAPGNFERLMKGLYRSIPLPLGTIYNKRSFVALDNLLDLIVTCIEHPAAANQIFLVSDGEDLSTTELLKRVAIALGKKSWLLPVNQKVLELGLKLVGKKNLAQRLCSSMQVDTSKAKKILNWTPPVSVDEGLRKTAEEFLRTVERQL